MKGKPIYKLESASLEEHPAALMWNRLNQCKMIPRSIERLSGSLSSKKSVIYRIRGIGENGSSIIAKCSFKKSLFTERFVYERILTQIPVSKLHYYGFIEEKKDERSWLFMEEVKGTPFKKNNKKHRELASMWLAKMHLNSLNLEISNELPQIGTDTYFNYLSLAVKNILNRLSLDGLTSNDSLLLNRIMHLCYVIKQHWVETEEICGTISPCLVHCDFIYKNVRVSNVKTRPTLFVYDWELSGWGIMAEDLCYIDLDVYWSIIKDKKFISSRENLEQLYNIGLILRMLASIYWASESLKYNWIDKKMRDLASYEINLSKNCKTMGWY